MDDWPRLMYNMYLKVAVKSLDFSPPPVKKEPITETVVKPYLHPMLFILDKKYADLYPSMDEATYERTKQRVRDHGFINPVTVSDDGVLYDGYHRLRIWKEVQEEGLKIDVPYQVRNFDTEEELLEFLRIKNEYRRHLLTNERAQAVIKLLPQIRKELQAEGHTRGAETKKGNKEPQSGKRSATDIAGEKVGVSGRTVRRKLAVDKSHHEDIKEAVAQGQMKINAAYEEVRKRDGKKKKSHDNGKANCKATQPAATPEPEPLEPEPSPDQLYSQVGRTANPSGEIHGTNLEPAPATMKPQTNMYVSASKLAKACFLRILIKRYGSNSNRKECMRPHEKEYLLWLDQFINGGKYIVGPHYESFLQQLFRQNHPSLQRRGRHSQRDSRIQPQGCEVFKKIPRGKMGWDIFTD